ncbi:conserved protein, unknown function, partial [Hepatocystis sp. ex Piliocolobus tephrosceles]
MLCFGKEDKLKINKNHNIHNYESNKVSNVENSINKNLNNNANNIYNNKNDTSVNIKNSDHDVSNITDVINIKLTNNTNLVNNVKGASIKDEIIYIGTSFCNCFIYIITKYYFYLFDNNDFSFINFYALKVDNPLYTEYEHHNSVFLSTYDNTIYIISNNLKYVFIYNITNTNDVILLDYNKNVHSLSINDYSDGDYSSSNENEYYEYITYIKNLYKKKKIHKNRTIKLVTVLCLPIPSNCLMVTQNNILFYSYQTNEIFISGNIKKIIANSKKKRHEYNVNKVIVNTKIISLNCIYYRLKGRHDHLNINRKTRCLTRVGSSKNINISSNIRSDIRSELISNDFISSNDYAGTSNSNTTKNNNRSSNVKELCTYIKQTPVLLKKKSKKKGIRHIYYSLKRDKIIRKYKRNHYFLQRVGMYCKNICSANISINTSKKKKKKWDDYNPMYLHSTNNENCLYKLIKHKNQSFVKNNKYKKSIVIKGIKKVQFNAYNDYVLLLSCTGDFYIFSFFYNFFNIHKSKACYYVGNSVHKTFCYDVTQDVTACVSKVKKAKEKEKGEPVGSGSCSGICSGTCSGSRSGTHSNSYSINRDERVIGVYVGSNIEDISLNIDRNIILIVNTNFIIKAYNIYPYICKHSFKKSLFIIDTFNTLTNPCFYYNYIIWNKQNNFFLVSFNSNNYYIYNTNGTLFYYKNGNDYMQYKASGKSDNEHKPGCIEVLQEGKDISDTLNNSSSHGINGGTINEIVNNNTNTNTNTNVATSTGTAVTITRDYNDSLPKQYINIAFIFNDFNLCIYNRLNNNNDSFYIIVKHFFYSTDIYSRNLIFHFNSNYYTNEFFKKIYIGLNKILIFDININNYNLFDREKNNVNIKEIITPFKFIKKAYLNFNNTYILIIFKEICIYNIKKKTFSYFVDEYLKFFFHNYPTGWIYDNIFFVTCLHNKYDEYNFKHFKNKKNFNLNKKNTLFNRDNEKEGKWNKFRFDMFNMEYGNSEVNHMYIEKPDSLDWPDEFINSNKESLDKSYIRQSSERVTEKSTKSGEEREVTNGSDYDSDYESDYDSDYESDYDSDYDSDYNSDYDSDYNSEYNSENNKEYDSEHNSRNNSRNNSGNNSRKNSGNNSR